MKKIAKTVKMDYGAVPPRRGGPRNAVRRGMGYVVGMGIAERLFTTVTGAPSEHIR